MNKTSSLKHLLKTAEERKNVEPLKRGTHARIRPAGLDGASGGRARFLYGRCVSKSPDVCATGMSDQTESD